VFDGHKQRRNGPCLCVAWKSILFSVFVCNLRQTAPLIILQIFDVLLQKTHHLSPVQVAPFHLNFGHNVETVQPNPLRSVVVTESVGYLRNAGIVAVVVVGNIGGMHIGKSWDSNRFRVQQMSLYLSNIGFGVFFIEEGWSDGNSYESVGSEALFIISKRRTY
jgi:hypothetical protein